MKPSELQVYKTRALTYPVLICVQQENGRTQTVPSLLDPRATNKPLTDPRATAK